MIVGNRDQHKAVELAIKYLLETQRGDGSWSGPYSSRIRETYLAYTAGKLLQWGDIEAAASNWLLHNKLDLGELPQERLLNSQYVNLFEQNPLDLSVSALYEDVIVRKTLQVLALSIVSDIAVIMPQDFPNLEVVSAMINGYLLKHTGKIKSWAEAEFLANLLIIEKKLGRSTSPIADQIFRLQDQKNNWYANPNTTLFCIIALQYAGELDDQSKYYEFVMRSQQPDGGWTFCELPLWDTGLSMQSLNLAGDNFPELAANISAAQESALEYIELSQNKDGGWGFYPGLESESDTSSILLLAISQCESSAVSSAEEYFRNLQFTDGKYKGLWPVWRQVEMPSLEVVGHIISALCSIGSDIDLQQSKAWLVTKTKGHVLKADWGRSIPYTIYAVLNNHETVTTRNYLIKKLIKDQNVDGGWGADSGQVSNASATGNAILALKLVDKPSKAITQAIQNGVSYLLDAQLSNGTWPRFKEVTGSRPFTYADDCSTHNFALQALLI